ncbi:017R [Invertebrate iridescent virus Kaz2018]|uniref:017R n=2 Tax=Iridovirus TaxID=10487 RepID=Q91G78_IIV6|nr:017R [Invertebrate iridescent virus 6]AAK81954.1 017R [Invertebrate iridescent virus 6]QMS79657.1 hypothetical protein IIV6-T1_019 [Invertebrate iridescent virus 6]QNH08425.1 017R [Invertebrate iridescent virus Kaz2018]
MSIYLPRLCINSVPGEIEFESNLLVFPLLQSKLNSVPGFFLSCAAKKRLCLC